MPDTERLMHLEAQINILAEKVTQTNSKVDDTNQKMSKILDLLVGNVLDKHDSGIIGRIEDNRREIVEHKKCIEELELKFKRIGWTIVGACLGSGVGGFTLAKFLEQLKH